ncbi:MAG TPA: hypothetical protein VN253_19610 [Kofleriaceae bacterium]|nr:hypothetical protein [Kofleriaceae bacterium]
MDMKRIIEDVEARIIAHPLAAVGAAFALGLLAGLRGGRIRAAESPRPFRSALTGVTGLAMNVARDYVLREAADAARRWWERRNGGVPGDDPNLEAFLEH